MDNNPTGLTLVRYKTAHYTKGTFECIDCLDGDLEAELAYQLEGNMLRYTHQCRRKDGAQAGRLADLRQSLY